MENGVVKINDAIGTTDEQNAIIDDITVKNLSFAAKKAYFLVKQCFDTKQKSYAGLNDSQIKNKAHSTCKQINDNGIFRTG